MRGFGARKWAIDHWPMVLREISYQKEHREAQKADPKVIWKREEQ